MNPENRRPRIAAICLGFSAFFCFTGPLLLCDCPGWYVLGAGFAAFACLRGQRMTRVLAIVFLVFGVIGAVWEAYQRCSVTSSQRLGRQAMIVRG